MNTRLVAVLRRWMTSSAAFFIFFVQLIQTCTFVLRRSASSQYFFMCVAWNHLVVNTFGGGPACFTGSFVRTIYSSWQVTASGLLPVPSPSNDPTTFSLRRIRTKHRCVDCGAAYCTLCSFQPEPVKSLLAVNSPIRKFRGDCSILLFCFAFVFTLFEVRSRPRG